MADEAVRATLNKSSLLYCFQNSLMQQGVCRILTNNSCCLKIAWNTVDAITGRMTNEEFCCTQATFLETRKINLKCDCRVFAERLKSIDGIEDGVCPHVLLFDTVHACVLGGVSATNTNTSTFERFLAEQLFQSGPVTCIHSDRSSYKFFVNVSEREASTNKTTQVSVCRMQRTDNKCYVCCENFRCKRGKMKNVKSTARVEDLCVHLQAIAEHPEHGEVMKRCQVNVNESGLHLLCVLNNVVECLCSNMSQSIDSVLTVC